MSETRADFIVVGSGCTGAMAAQTLVEAGENVLMLDVGITSSEDAVPKSDFITLRRQDSDQQRYFIGRDIEHTTADGISKGAQITPPRQHMLARTHQLLPVNSESFYPVESLGYGGLGIGWGLGCWQWSAAELYAAGLDTQAMRQAYDTVARRVGISATKDNARDYTLGTLQHYQRSPKMDRNGQQLYSKYLRHQKSLARRGFIMGRAPLALLTKDLGGRKAYAYRDLDYYADNEKSAWRPWMTVDNLKRRKNFRYVGNQMVLSFKEQPQAVTVKCRDITTDQITVFKAKKLVLAPGVLGSARIVIRSMGQDTVKLPLLCNPYTLLPCLQPRLFGKAAEPQKLGFAQLSLFLDEDGGNFGAAMASMYSYQSLMMFRVIKSLPLNFVDGRLITQYLMSGLIVMGIHQPDTMSKNKYVQLKFNTDSSRPDTLRAHHHLTNQEIRRRHQRESAYLRAMVRLGTIPIKRIDPGMGSSIHYAGTLPYSTTNQPYRLNPDGRLHGTQRVFVADGSGFGYLPAKGLTFTLMANAHRVAEEARR